MDGVYQFGISLIQWLQTLSPGLDGVMKIFTFLGTVEFYILFVPALYWSVNQSLGLRVLFILITTDVFASGFKQLLHQPRPYWIGGVEALSTETSYGIPSSHASNTLAVWILIATTLKKGWMWLFTIILLFLIGLSRLYLGVHFPQDVLGGWLLGLISLALFLKYERRILDWWITKKLGTQIWLGFGLSIAILLFGTLVLWAISGSLDPPKWAEFAAEARDISHYFTLSGFGFGAVAGVALMQKYARFRSDGSALMRVIRYAAGMIVLFAVYLGLDLLFARIAPDASITGYILRYIRYAIVSLWASFGAPWVFIKLRLVQTATQQKRLRHLRNLPS